jgi:hypothetical protein
LIPLILSVASHAEGCGKTKELKIRPWIDGSSIKK